MRLTGRNALVTGAGLVEGTCGDTAIIRLQASARRRAPPPRAAPPRDER